MGEASGGVGGLMGYGGVSGGVGGDIGGRTVGNPGGECGVDGRGGVYGGLMGYGGVGGDSGVCRFDSAEIGQFGPCLFWWVFLWWFPVCVRVWGSVGVPAGFPVCVRVWGSVGVPAVVLCGSLLGSRLGFLWGSPKSGFGMR